ncbi:MAG: hypothetical protein E7571_07065 [Ruminococcaceae bacterium]|nr:hypothetical protein [Oscillospiraceae bacterium]
MKKIISFFLTILLVCIAPLSVFADADAVLTVSEKDISHKVSPLLYGVSLDNVSFALDGGLVSDLINNGSFENESKPENAWVFDNIDAVLSHDDAINTSNPSYETLTVDGKGTLENLGYTEIYDYKTYDFNEKSSLKGDMGFFEGVDYDFSCYVKNVDFSGNISVYLNSKNNSDNIIQMAINGVGNTEWTKISTTLHSAATEDGSLVVVLDGSGTIKFDFASLVPQNSYGYGKEEWKYTTLRSDMTEAIKNLNPSFIRFPGGATTGGKNSIYNWKDTIGELSQRKQSVNVWEDADGGRYAINTNAMGYHECFQLCEDLNAEPVPVVNAGLVSQERGSYADLTVAYQKLNMDDDAWRAYLVNEHGFDEKDDDGIEAYTKHIDSLGIKSKADYQKQVEKMILKPGSAELNNYIQDVLDLVEYATADSKTSYWGALRSANGHSEPFSLKYLAIGSGNWGDVYFENLQAIYSAVHKAYPKLKLIVSAGTTADGSDFESSWDTINQQFASAVADEHYSVSGDWMLEHTDRYDSYDREGAAVMLGEYGAFSEDFGTMITKTNMHTAAAVGAYMTGLERNSDIVTMTSLAPAFAKVNANAVDESLVWFDSQSLAYSADYYTELLFANNIGTHYVDANFTAVEGLYQSTTVDKGKEVLYIKLVNTGKKTNVTVNLDGFDATSASVQRMSHKYDSASNELEKQRVAPEEKALKLSGNSLEVELEGDSVNVVRIAYGNNNGEGFYSVPDTINTKTVKYIPSKLIAAVIIISLALLGGMVIGYIIFVKRISKNNKR